MTSSNAVHIRPIAAVLTAVGLVASASAAAGQGQTTRQGEPPNITAGGQTNWTSHNLDLDNSRYSELGEVNTETVGGLAERWSYEVAAGTDVSEVTPLVVDGVMYFHAGASVIAVNAVTGAEVWTLELDEARRNRVRGPTYAEGKIYSYNGPNLVAADAKTGELVESFGDGGVLPVVGLALQAKYPDTYPPTLDPHTLGYRITAAPAYHDGTLYAGAALSEGHIPGGLVIATDATTGAIEWVFNTIPQRPQDDGWEIAQDTWGDGQRAGGGVWTQPAIDLDLGLIYFNTGNPSPDYDGSARPGANLFTNATIALDLETGALRWYYQAVHHDLWDWDHVTGPVLFDVTGDDGETIRGVGAAGKNCLLYLWDRETGEPINPMVETLVSTATNVPGEVVYPTQPIPYNARGVPLTPFCATYVHLDDRGAAGADPADVHAVLHRGAPDRRPRRIELRLARVQPADRAALRHRQERGRLDDRQPARRQPGAGSARRRPQRQLRGAEPHSRLHADHHADRLRAGQRGRGVAGGVPRAQRHRGERQPRDRGRPRVPGRGRRRVLRVRRRDRRAVVPPPGAACDPVEPDDVSGQRQAVRHGDCDQHGADLRATGT